MGYLACFAFIFKSVKSFPKDERIQILLEYFEMIQNLQDTCCNLARYQRKINAIISNILAFQEKKWPWEKMS